MAPHRRTVSSTASCDEERVCDSHETREEGEKGSKKSGIAGDEGNIAILLFLYVLQGIPLGLAAAVPLILTNRNVSYKQQAGFSFAYWPFSIKLLWAPIVDSCFFPRFGRRKTWLVPVQYLIGATMLVLAHNVDHYLGTENGMEPNVQMLTAMFFFLNFLAATQDIAVDGWALTMLQRHNVGYASTCNSVGQTAGYFLGYVFYMALESYGLVTISGFLKFWSVVFLITTTLVGVLKTEQDGANAGDDEPDLGVVETYRLLWDIVKLPVMPATIAMLLTSKIGFSAADAVTGLKLIEKGVPKTQLAMLAIPMMPLQIVLPWVISKYTAGPRPLDVFVKAIPFRLAIGLFMAWFVSLTPNFKLENGEFPFYYYCLLLGIYAVYQVALYSMFVSIMAFFAKISDPAVGGTYMTFLNTLTNLGGNWPATLALWWVDPLTFKSCVGGRGSCYTPEGTKECEESNGRCVTDYDGYYLESAACFTIGLVWLLSWGRGTIHRLQDEPDLGWRVVKSGEDKK